MRNIVMFFSFVLILNSCTNSSNEIPVVKIKTFSYKIIERHELLKNDSLNFVLYAGSVILEIPDTVLQMDIALNANEICAKENLIFAKFYKSEECWENDTLNKFSETFNESTCYIGYVNCVHKGLHWRYEMNEHDFRFNNGSGIPINKFPQVGIYH